MTRPAALALVHHPVRDRNGGPVTAAVTNLDLHDLARLARTYGLERVYVVTPVAEQQRLVAAIREHWVSGFGAGYNPHRREALELVETVATVEESLERWSLRAGSEIQPLLTGAGRQGGLSCAAGRALAGSRALLLIFGTGWGLAPELFERGWPVLASIRGNGNYHHLPVRAAAAIYLDRLFGTACSSD